MGYVHVVKDGYLVGGGNAKYDTQSGIITAWFPAARRQAQVLMMLDLKVNAHLHVVGRGSIRMHHGNFCAFPELAPRPSEDYPDESAPPGSSRATTPKNRFVGSIPMCLYVG